MKKILLIFLLFCLPCFAGVDDAYTKTLLHFNGNLADEAGKTWTASGDAVATSTSPKFGSGCLFPGITGQISTPNSADLEFGTASFTVDFWARSGLGSFAYYLYDADPTLVYSSFFVMKTDADVFAILFYSDGTTPDFVGISSEALTDSNWHHYALVRDGTAVYFFMDGVALTLDNSYYENSLFSGGTLVRVGVSGYSADGMDEIRISKGVARWTSGFSVPTSEYTGATPVACPSLFFSTSGKIFLSENGKLRFAQ